MRLLVPLQAMIPLLPITLLLLNIPLLQGTLLPNTAVNLKTRMTWYISPTPRMGSGLSASLSVWSIKAPNPLSIASP